MCALETRKRDEEEGTPSLAPWLAMGGTWDLEPDSFLSSIHLNLIYF